MIQPKRWNARKHFNLRMLVLCLLTLSAIVHVSVPMAHASSSINIITNPGFEQGSTAWGFTQPPGCEGTANATWTVDPTQWADGAHSAKVATGPLTQTGGCSTMPGCPCPISGRMAGFSQYGQIVTSATNPQGFNITQLTDSPNGLSFWFQLQPYNTNGIAGFEVRIFGAENGAELDYVFDPESSLASGYSNNTSSHFLLFSGYNPGQWYHFSRDLKADWMMPAMTSMGQVPGLSLTYNFTLIQFEGFATQYGSTVTSETYWLDDVRVYVGANPPTPDAPHYALFNFTDTNGKIVDNLVKWKLFDWTGQEVTYILGQNTLLTGPYILEVYYLAYGQDTLIFRVQIHLDTRSVVPLAMVPNNSVPGNYVVLNNSVTSVTIDQPDSSSIQAILRGTIGTAYTMLLQVTAQPLVVQANGIDLSQGTDWTYNSGLSLTHVQFIMPSGTENITLFFKVPQRQPFISFTDRTGAALTSRIAFQIIDSRGNKVPYAPGTVLPSGTYFLEAYYEGYRIYRSPLNTNQTTPIIVNMLRLGTAANSYLVLNSTATSLSILDVSSSEIAFQVQGSGPYLIVLNVPAKPLRVEQDGQLIFWTYNATTNTVAIETTSQGSFQVILQENPSYPYLYIAAVVGTLIIAVLAGTLLLLRRRSPRQLSTRLVGKSQA